MYEEHSPAAPEHSRKQGLGDRVGLAFAAAYRGYTIARYAFRSLLFKSGQRTRSPLQLEAIGFWAEELGSAHGLRWPDPHDLVDEDWDPDERLDVASYLEHGVLLRAFLGASTCRICGDSNGSREYTDGYFYWPEGLAHYVREHSVRLPQRFVDHVRSMESELYTARLDTAWWNAQSDATYLRVRR